MKEELAINESIPKISVSDMVTLLSKAYSNIIKNNIIQKHIPANGITQ